jgi:hypothetical protein
MTNDANTPRKYEATLYFTQHSKATVIIEATSLEEAVEKADDINADEIDDWNPFDGEVVVDTVQSVKGGKDEGHWFFDGAFVKTAKGGQDND